MRLIWKLLRRHISVGQLTGYLLANLFGLAIVLAGFQFYRDVIPLFRGSDTLMKNEYLILNKQVGTLGSGKSNLFSEQEIKELRDQSFVASVGSFTVSRFKVSAGVGVAGRSAELYTEMFFESVPDAYIDINLDKWHFAVGDQTIPIIIPRNYLNLYNFGFAQSRSLPKLSEGVIGLIQMEIDIRGNGRIETFRGKIVGFSNRLNTILVPQDFMDWANGEFADGKPGEPSRLIVEIKDTPDDAVVKYLHTKGYEIEGEKLDSGKMAYFLKLVVGIVVAIGLLITVLSFYILILSIYLLLQKNASKLENLLLIGYSPAKVALPYQILTCLLNLFVLAGALALVSLGRNYYLSSLSLLSGESSGIVAFWPVVGVGLLIAVAVSILNIVIIRRKVTEIYGKK
ncbi:MAG: ABC transporter permease [Bacteroides sp.]|nr:ABC transporter permease [Bacteroides sp.]